MLTSELKPSLDHILWKHLNEQGKAKSSRRAYLYLLSKLIEEAERTGSVPPTSEREGTWKTFRTLIKGKGLRSMIDQAVGDGKGPAEYADADLESWGARKLDEGCGYQYVRDCKQKFRRLVFGAGLNREMPRLSPPSIRKSYGIRLEKLREPLRTETKDLKDWKTQEFADGRGYTGRNRDITASTSQKWICRIVGLLADDGIQVSSLGELFTQEHMLRFLRLARKQRKLSGNSLRHVLGLVFAAVKHYPPLQDDRFPDKFRWMSSVISQIPPDPESRKRRSKESKWVKYSLLQQIPATIEAEITANPKADARWIALMRQKQLIIKWLNTSPWRQRNLREARLASSERHANIFYDEVSELSPMDLPPWAEAQLKRNPRQKLWQFAFDEEETKAGREARGVISGLVTPLLEEFLRNYRHRLVNGTDPGTLFLNAWGKPFTDDLFYRLVADTAFRYVKRRVHPHLFRDIFAVAFLKDTRDYLSLSKVLWHKNPKITIEEYGRFFDESAGARVVEEWLEGRRFAGEPLDDVNNRMQQQDPEEQLQSLQDHLREKMVELDRLKTAIGAIEAKIGRNHAL